MREGRGGGEVFRGAGFQPASPPWKVENLPHKEGIPHQGGRERRVPMGSGMRPAPFPRRSAMTAAVLLGTEAEVQADLEALQGAWVSVAGRRVADLLIAGR